MRVLEDKGIYQIGRYGRWRFQGIADSIRDGFVAGSSFRTIGDRRPGSHRGRQDRSPKRVARDQA
jgi:hypothetical protein